MANRVRQPFDKPIWPKRLCASPSSACRGAASGGAIFSFHQLAAPQQTVSSPFQFLVTSLSGTLSGNEYRIPTGFYTAGAYGLPQPALNSISNHSIPDPLACHKPEPALLKPIGKVSDYQQTVRRAAAVPMDLGKPLATGQARPLLHELR